MLRTSRFTFLKHRPATVSTEVSSNARPNEKYLKQAMETFVAQPFPRKKVIHNWRFFIRPGKATSGSAVGQEFTKLGMKAMDFCKLFNDKTKPIFKDDSELQIRIQVYYDKTFTWRIEPPPTAWFLMRAVRKKRRETAPVHQRGAYTAYVTLEMLYEIAKHRFKSFPTDPTDVDGFCSEPPLEKRVQALAFQARRMGIAIIGVDCASSPVAGLSASQYAKQSNEYRAQQYEKHMELKQKQLETKAPLMDRLHRPNYAKLSAEQLKKGLTDPKMVNALWRATAPSSRYLQDLKDRQNSLRMLQHAGWIGKDMTLEEAKAYFVNWRLPTVERVRALREEDSFEDNANPWSSRDTVKEMGGAGKK